MKISDYIMQFIHGLGVGHVFYVSGGGAMHMNDSLGRSEMKPVAMLFEQGAAIAAGVGVGIWKNFADAARTVKTGETCLPDEEMRKVYVRQEEIFGRLYGLLKEAKTT